MSVIFILWTQRNIPCNLALKLKHWHGVYFQVLKGPVQQSARRNLPLPGNFSKYNTASERNCNRNSRACIIPLIRAFSKERAIPLYPFLRRSLFNQLKAPFILTNFHNKIVYMCSLLVIRQCHDVIAIYHMVHLNPIYPRNSSLKKISSNVSRYKRFILYHCHGY